MKFRTESRSPMLSAVNTSPRGSIVSTPLGTSSAASGMSCVTATSPASDCSAMYRSAASADPSTRTLLRNA